MNIGIIGAGRIGGTLARRLRQLGHEVRVANSRDPETLAGLAAETGATAVWAAEVARDADAVIISIPLRAVPALPRGVLDGIRPGAPVIDTNNYYPQRDGHIAAIEQGTTSSRWVAEQLGSPHVVKVFNNIYAQHLLEGGRPRGAPGRRALPVAGDDATAKATVMRLVDELGFDPVDAGSLDESWRQEPDTPVYGADLDAAGVERGLAEATRKYTPASQR